MMRKTVVILTPVLVLNVSYEPIAVCVARRARTMVCKGVARIEESHDCYVHREMRLPSVIRLSEYRRVPARRHTASRKNISCAIATRASIARVRFRRSS